MALSTVQYLRSCRLIVSTATGTSLDLSNFRIKFSVKQTNLQTPNVADIFVYNLADAQAVKIQKKYTRVLLQAGYQGNYGVIFQGNIKQTIIGRESGTETFLEIIAGDGDLAYNFAVVATTISKGSNQQDQINAAANAMTPLGTTSGPNTTVPPDLDNKKLPRGKVMFGNARNYLRNSAKSTKTIFSVQNEKIVFVPQTTFLPGTVIILNSSTGMIGSPQQTLQGVNVKCLLNPKIKIATRVQLNNSSIQRLAINLSQPGTAASIPAPLTTDGVYFVSAINHTGDTRGTDWYSALIMLFIDPTTGVLTSTEVGFE